MAQIGGAVGMAYIGELAASWVGATALGVVVSGAPAMDVATSISGGAGAALGYFAGQRLAEATESSYSAVLPLAGALIVPGLAGGQWDMTVVALAGGAFIGCQAYSMYMKQ